MSPADARWQPGADLATARVRARMLAAARRFFDAHGLLEVETPAVSTAAVSDPNIESVEVRLHAAGGRPCFLHTSPEYAMKRLLAAGWPDIFQVCRVFRDGEVGRRHQPEFTMIEWYRSGFGLTQMMRHTVDFIEALLTPGRVSGAPRYVGYADAFRRQLGIDPLAAPTAELRAAARPDAQLAGALGEDRDAWLDLLLAREIVPRFPARRLTVLHHYPASQAALARRCPDDERVADRFEVFCGPLELANGYHELGDAAEQRARFAGDQARRQRAGRPLRPLDEKLLAALDAGLPDCAGVALGFDRLVMLECGRDRLREVQLFTALEDNDD